MSITQKKQSRFTLFVKLKQGIISHFPGQERVWCFRGDKFAKTEQRQIKNLINHIENKIINYQIVELYDNNFEKNKPQRLIIKYKDGIIEKNDLFRYKTILSNYSIPKFLK